ncbi:unnamed protein product [Rotaria sp. Silwood2]|nr:unnamed protein product [Rotaria sp. Silwood2]CAF2669999.1 unnamed protein product [Rotaria sp. Silwood2]CAF2946950.1 unnamed protein product [Rotaria sp. Silwood2]CAF3104298.1 unnamed protein product [Rotaria sp. Silwood2]CAF3971269.1 unnamed protein product [Rotaria sp. Silwood2]
MDKYIINLFNLESDVNNITPLDIFKTYRNLDAYNKALQDYASQHQLTEVEQFFFNMETDPRRKFFYRISQTYFHNYFLSIYFILSNPVLITKPTFDNLYREKHLLPEITDHIIDLYKTMDPESSRFFNKVLLDKFISNFDFSPLPDDSTGPEYKTYFSLFTQETTRLKMYLTELIKDPKWLEHPEQGLSQYEPQFYQFIFEYNTGLKLNSSNDFIQIKKWAQKHLDQLMEEVNETCNRLLTNNEDKQKSVYEKMMLVGYDPSQHWSSKQEMIDAHELCVSKYRRIFISQNQFKEFDPPGLIILDNPLLAGGYYHKGNFYLNVCHWANGNFKYEVENLVLHETIPGHHLQLDISYHSPNHNYLTAVSSEPCNGYIEGWALFAEHLGDSMLDDPWVYFGYLQSNILRTFRIIAEILLHVEGQTPKQVIELAKQYLTTSEASITSEIYRYRTLPGQACSYKIGLEVFKRIIQQKFNVVEVKDYMRSDLQDWYKQVLWQSERPLDVLLRENRVAWTFDE